ncbi:MAG: MBL fold metallo-hydrolase, partial [Patescibacteria group bacterium]
TKATSLKRFNFVHNSEWFSPWPGWKIRFRSSGHINGAATIDIVSPSGFRIIHSGDISFHDQPTIKGANIANDFKSPELLITEATYGDRDLPNRDYEEQKFVSRIIEVLNRCGKVLIPSFSITGPNVGVIVADGLAKAGVNVPVYIDGMIRHAARIINGSNEWSLNDNGLVFPKNLIAVPEEREKSYVYRQEFLDGGPAVIVSSHGMIEGGMVFFYLPYILSDYKSAVLIPGYQAEGTGGRRLLELERGNQFQINNRWIPKYCDVERFHLSSHASGNELASWISEIRPSVVIGTHATLSAFRGLREKVNHHNQFIRVLGGYNSEEIRDL